MASPIIWSDFKRFSSSGRTHLLRHVLERFQLLGTNEIKLGHKIIKVFVASVDVGLGSKGYNTIKVMDIDVDKDTEETGQDFSADTHKVLWKRVI